MNPAGWIGASFAAALGATALWWRWFEWSRLYHPHRTLLATPDQMGLEFEDVEFVAEDAVRLHGWWVPHTDARGAVLYCHGNGDNIGDLTEVIADLHELGVHVFVFDYRGYGRSRGLPTERGTYRDARAAFECVRARYDDADYPPVVVLGRSLGGAIAAQLALDKPVRGLVLESTFASTVAMGRRLYPRLPVEWLCRYRYDTVTKLPRIRVPTLIAHSPEDGLIPMDQAKALFEASAGSPKRFVELQGPHNEAGWRRTPAYWKALQEWLDLCLGAAGADSGEPGNSQPL